jgi:peptidylprolyl isomerase
MKTTAKDGLYNFSVMLKAFAFVLCTAWPSLSAALGDDYSSSSGLPSTVSSTRYFASNVVDGNRQLTVEEKTQFTLKKDIEKLSDVERVVTKGSKVSFHVVIQLEDGKKVFDSIAEGRPWTGTVGDGSILTGINDGLYGMAEGGKRSLWIPSHLAYGANGVAPNIPPNAKLYAEITLVSIDGFAP